MAKSAPVLPLQQSLFPPPPPQSTPVAAAAKTSLWAALVFPRLALEVLREPVDESPWVVVQAQRGQSLVYAASEPARAQGVAMGMALTAAYALCPVLQTEERDAAAEQSCLAALADRAGQYSSMVSLEPDGLLLEIGASLKLFGGLGALQAQLRHTLQQLPHVVSMAVTPTPQAALLLARCAVEATVTEAEALRAALGDLPLAALSVSNKQARLFSRLGLRNLRDLWRLPGDGLARRFGREFVDYLNRLLGHTPEPRPAHQGAPEFSTRWVFPIETDNTTFILHALEQLLPQLIRFMRARELALERLQIMFYHPGKQISRLELGMQRLCRDAAHMLELLRERLEREVLIAPVLELELSADELHPFNAHNAPLFSRDDEDDGEWQQLLDQLQNRLGAAAVTGLQLLDEHRPEHAWDYGPAQSGETAPGRPLWLLPQPSPLPGGIRGMTLLSEPERIESGWWDGRDLRRDYYRARDKNGRRLWLFRDLNDGRWYLHGLFG
ncbi:hypothetical protein Tel_06860 [Candidatus Tenderia electrophaga]|jgi:protein ImuB|uniref:UmuC domain-containing protein n=1 Tax=Candidatus Tenderia electrophaga TaxID=1748243 RepID=A0A0S2TCQ2_9GAMM|nr:hypothetical protein Tel_06860 [Candidatus Tenderia electrophaga]